MIANNYYTDDADLVLFFEELIDWEPIVKACEGSGFDHHKKYIESENERYAMAPGSVDEAVELYRSTLDALGTFCGHEIAQAAAAMDKKGLKFANGQVEFPEENVKLYEMFRDTGLLPYSMPREAGGLGMPATMSTLINFVMARADVSFCMTASLLNLAQIAARYGTPEQIEQWALPAASGERLFAMSLTEPDYGSDLASVRTTAVRQDDGSYRINGTKRFISQGCGLGPYPATHLVLARTGKQGGGARGLSVFLVKGEDSEIAGIEKKMGIHVSPTCEVVYENTPGELLGKEGQGLTRCTIGMTNFMRLVSAAGGAGGGASALFEAMKYADEREQFGKPIAQIPAVADILDKMRREVNAMRLLAIETGIIVDMYQHEQIRMEKEGKPDREIRRHDTVGPYAALATLFTPMAKYYCSETGIALSSMAIQIHGGSGYTEEYDVARLFRDGRINAIYEGTSQIQVRSAVGGISAGMAGDGNLRQYINRLLAELPNQSDFLKEQADQLESSLIAYRAIDERTGQNGVKDRFSEDLVMMTIRYITSIYYERAVQKLSKAGGVQPDVKTRWQHDCRAYQLDSLAIGRAAACRIENADRVFQKAQAAAQAG